MAKPTRWYVRNAPSPGADYVQAAKSSSSSWNVVATFAELNATVRGGAPIWIYMWKGTRHYDGHQCVFSRAVT